MNKLKEYIEQDIWNPKYLFHGSPYIFDILEPRQSFDSQNKNNEDNAIFLTSWFINAAAYAFRNKLKEVNKHYKFSMNNVGKIPTMFFQVDNLPTDLFGYIYIFDKKEDMVKDNNEHTTQYRCYHSIKPDKILKIFFKDFSQFFQRILFTSESIYFTQLSESFTDDYLNLFNNSEIQKTLYGTEKNFSKCQIITWIQNSLQQQKPIFSLIDSKSNQFLGFSEIVFKENGIGEIAIALLPDKQGKGYGREAITSILKYGYEKLGLKGFELYVLKSNRKAINCYKKVGFVEDGNGYTEQDVYMHHVK